MKRNKNLIPLSREHHFGLLCCWKIRQGIKLGVEYNRIKDYINFFWKERLVHHFHAEDIAFSNINMNEKNVIMQQEHLQIETLISLINQSENEKLLLEFAKVLENHIRFEEREFFPDLEQILSDTDLSNIGKKIEKLKIEGDDNYYDKFWERSKK